MRTIKFRGIERGTGKWVYGYLTEGDDFPLIWEKEGEFPKRVNGETVGQFTNKKDENRVEIYDGDIIEGKNIRSIYYGYTLQSSKRVEHYITVVGWDLKCGRWHLMYSKGNYLCFNELHYLRVIGSMHKNPELLKKKRRWKTIMRKKTWEKLLKEKQK